VQVRNQLLRLARERTPSRQVPGEWLSRHEVAEAVNMWIYENTKKTTTLDANYLAKLERGVVRWPSAHYRADLRAVLGVATDAELGFYPPRRSGTTTRADVPMPQPADPEPMDTAAHLNDIAQRYETLPSASLLAEAGQCHASITLLLRQAQSERVRRELHAAATASAVLMSQLVWDVSQRRDYDATVAYCDEAIAHGRECGDAVAVVHAELRKGFAALYGRAEIRDPRTGLNFAQAAAEQSRGVSDALYGLSLLHVGEAYAMLGEHRQCERALSAAETAFGQIDGDDPGVSFYSPTQLSRLAGSCYLFLGHPERAEPLLDATAKALHSRRKTRSLVLGNLALAYLRQRQLEAATATLHEAIDLLDDTRGGGGLTVVFGATRELYPWRHEQAVHDVQDRLLALVART
jgi:tetratricopeptide (TPR) repeat protein